MAGGRNWSSEDEKLLARYFEQGMPRKEIAKRLGRSVLSINNRLNILDISQTERAINKYKINGEVTELIILQPGKRNTTILIDTYMLEEIQQYVWTTAWFKNDNLIKVFPLGQTKIRRHKHLLESQILNCNNSAEKIVVFLNGNKLDFRKENLEVTDICGARQFPKSTNPLNVTGELNVGWNKSKQKYQVQLEVNRKRVFHKCYKDFTEAVIAAREARQKFNPYSHEAQHGVDYDNIPKPLCGGVTK